MRPPHFAHSTASSHALKRAACPGGGAGAPSSLPVAFRDATGFAVAVGPETPLTPPPTREELTVLRAIDPGGVVRSEFA